MIATDTSSAAAGTSRTVDDDADDDASLTASPIPLKSADTPANASGAAIKKGDIVSSS